MSKNWKRNLFIRLLLRAVPYKVVRFPGVSFDKSDHEFDKYLKHDVRPDLKEKNKDRYKGVVGCWIAHSRVLEPIKERKGVTVVLEDDFVCRRNFFNDALKMVNTFDRDFDIIVFDPCGKGPFGMHKVSENIYSPKKYCSPFYLGSQCLFVNNEKIPKILDAKLNAVILDYDAFVFCGGMIDSYLFYTGASAVRNVGSDITPGYDGKDTWADILTCLLPHMLREKSPRFRRYFYSREEKGVILTDQEMAAFEGYYVCNGRPDITIKNISNIDRSMLLASWDKFSEVLHPMSQLDFLTEQAPIDLKFMKSEEGEVSGVLVYNQYLYRKIG
ncbi:hypothetical protein Q4E93_34300 [Flavitalea sp. BT771]|uniref:hypothetical protein n=1 Tax=Flavitalea sp. BT771 TaxID=3063329 RepID=UPI0026E3617E|nr:hypothetical protein [Flavitalea sp. BT771]MDO6435737.1 hypothetical protein [Flavitalea sp. BT771]MDV6224638.1 hypothetical protein [Flavitalea sp. BT771]